MRPRSAGIQAEFGRASTSPSLGASLSVALSTSRGSDLSRLPTWTSISKLRRLSILSNIAVEARATSQPFASSLALKRPVPRLQ